MTTISLKNNIDHPTREIGYKIGRLNKLLRHAINFLFYSLVHLFVLSFFAGSLWVQYVLEIGRALYQRGIRDLSLKKVTKKIQLMR